MYDQHIQPQLLQEQFRRMHTSKPVSVLFRHTLFEHFSEYSNLFSLKFGINSQIRMLPIAENAQTFKFAFLPFKVLCANSRHFCLNSTGVKAFLPPLIFFTTAFQSAARVRHTQEHTEYNILPELYISIKYL